MGGIRSIVAASRRRRRSRALRRRRLVPAAWLGVVLWLVAATSPSLAQGFVDAVADAWLEEAAPTQNYGSDRELSIRANAGERFRAVLRFDLTGLAPNANITAAEAWFRVVDPDDSGQPVNIYAVTDGWSEGSVNWSNTGNAYDATTVHGTFVPDLAGWATADITALVQAWVCGEIADHGIALIPTSADGESKYTSREWPSHGQRPRLRITSSGTNPCADTVDHFTVVHDAFGIYCLPEVITVRVADALGNLVSSYAEQVTLDTQSGQGNWTLLAGSGVLTDGVADDGIASYQWASGESEATFALSYSAGAPPIDVDVYQSDDSLLRDDDSEGSLSFSANGFTLSPVPIGNPPVVTPFDQPRIAAEVYDVYLAAYGITDDDAVCGVIETYTGDRSLSFWSTYVNPGTGTRNVEIDGIPVAATEAAAAPQTVTFTNGLARVDASYKDVGRIQILVKDDSITDPTDLPTGIRGATAAFVTLPATFELSDIRNGPGTVVNPAAVDANGPVFIAAGTDFRATVTALDLDGDPTPNYGRESTPETVRLDVSVVAPSPAVDAPAITAPVGFGAFADGTATGFDFGWPEVGIIELTPAVGDGDYLGAGDVTGTTSGNVGRFVPYSFELALNVPELGTECAPVAPTATPFTYMGQRFDYTVEPVITVTAKAFGTPAPTTDNYTGAFFKLSEATLMSWGYASWPGTLLGPTAQDATVVETSPGVGSITFDGGPAGFAFARELIAPFGADIDLTVDVVDADGVMAPAPAEFLDIAFSDGDEIRYGRARLRNAVGSERVDLAVPFVAEYFAGPGVGFVRNADEECLADVTLALSAFTENLAPGETCALDAGAPGASGIGCAAAAPVPQRFEEPPIAGDFNLTLAAPGVGNTGSVTIAADVPAWLEFDWDAAAAGDEDPTGQVTFGIFGGENAQIYLREIY